MIFKRQSATYEYLIAGLGNPGEKYERTRHNVGFATIEEIADVNKLSRPKLKHKSELFDCKIEGVRCLLCKPQTYMNNSGEAVGEIAKFYKIPPQNIIVISDDVTLDVGALRIRRKGSAGGHNGLKSIINHLGSEEFIRVKIGVGKKPHPEYDLVDWVLGRFNKEDLPKLKSAVEDAAKSVNVIIKSGVDAAMNKYNR